jgi:hypothetical protein
MPLYEDKEIWRKYEWQISHPSFVFGSMPMLRGELALGVAGLASLPEACLAVRSVRPSDSLRHLAENWTRNDEPGQDVRPLDLARGRGRRGCKQGAARWLEPDAVELRARALARLRLRLADTNK